MTPEERSAIYRTADLMWTLFLMLTATALWAWLGSFWISALWGLVCWTAAKLTPYRDAPPKRKKSKDRE